MLPQPDVPLTRIRTSPNRYLEFDRRLGLVLLWVQREHRADTPLVRKCFPSKLRSRFFVKKC